MKKPLSVFSFFAFVLFMSPMIYGQEEKRTFSAGIERISPELDAIIAKEAQVKIIAEGFDWSEGPVWVENNKMLLFSDVPKNKIYKWTEKKGIEIFLEPSGYTNPKMRGGETGSNGLALNNKNQLVLCQHGDRRIALLKSSLNNPKPLFTTLADNYKGRKFDSPNDLTIKRNGVIYFTDPPYGLEKNVNDPLKEAKYQGVYKVSPNGEVTLLTDSITRPNGIALFPDERRILVANSDSSKPYLYVFYLDDAGNFINGKIFYDFSEANKTEKRAPDGLKIDKNGNVFTTGPGGVWILDKTGKVLGRIKVSGTTSNCAFANNYKTLFITADNYILKVDLRK